MMIPGSLYELHAIAAKESINMHGHSLSQCCIAIVLLASLLLQSCSESHRSGTLRMVGSEGAESTDEKSSAGQAMALGGAPGAGLLAAYVNFLLAKGQVAEAHKYLLQAIESGDGVRALYYGMIERATVSPLLWERIEQDKGIQVRGIDYAFYLLIHHYEDFVQAGLGFKKSKSDYLTEYAQSIIDRAGKAR